MITVSQAARAAIEDGTFTYHISVQSWLGDDLLADDVPVVDGSEDGDRSLAVPERVVLTVPRKADGFTWAPDSDTHPLAAAGQVLKVSLGIEQGADGVEWFQRGEFVILSTEEDSDTVRVTAAGLLYLISEAGFVSPFQPAGTIGGTVRALVEPAVHVDLDNAPADRSVPSAVNYDQSRLDALYEVLDAWTAVPFMNEQGYLEVRADETPDEAVRWFSNGAGGTVITALGSSTREGGFNAVVATGTDPNGAEVRGVSYVTTGPWTYGSGPANPLPVPFGYSSPLITTVPQAQSAADTVKARKMRESVLQRFVVTCVPDPAIQLGDPVGLTIDGWDVLCTVEANQLPYLPGTQQMTLVSTT